MPELPAARRARYLGLGLPLQDVLLLAEEPVTATFFDTLLVSGGRWSERSGSRMLLLLVAWLPLSLRAALQACPCALALRVQAVGASPKGAANWITGDIQAYCKVRVQRRGWLHMPEAAGRKHAWACCIAAAPRRGAVLHRKTRKPWAS